METSQHQTAIATLPPLGILPCDSQTAALLGGCAPLPDEHHRQKLCAQLECLAGIIADMFATLSKDQQAFYALPLTNTVH
jgi:hypothetical protein